MGREERREEARRVRGYRAWRLGVVEEERYILSEGGLLVGPKKSEC